MSAVFSPCEKYRYTLGRTLQSTATGKLALFIMLNPSTADATKDDPTIRRCISFAKREKCSELTVVNLFAFRATNPDDLHKVDDPVGSENDLHISRAVARTIASEGIIIAAWGSQKIAELRGRHLLETYGSIFCLGKTKNGSPKHPLYIPSNAPLVSLGNL